MLVRVKRTGSSISSRPVNERVWPLCGVAERKSRCSNCGATRRSIRQSSLSSPNGDGIRLWHSSTISRSQGVRLKQVTVRLDLPEDAFFGGRAIVLVFEVDEMETPRLAVEGLDGRDHSAPVADGRKHAGAGDGDGLRCGCG